jgi:hypothetical protein
LDQVKAERFFLVRRAGFGWPDRPDEEFRRRIASGLLRVL